MIESFNGQEFNARPVLPEGFTKEIIFQLGYWALPKAGSHNDAFRFRLYGPEGVIEFVLNTGWMVGKRSHRQTAYAPFEGLEGHNPRYANESPSGAHVSSHTPVPHRNADSGPHKCDILPGEVCWGGTGYTLGAEAWNALAMKGEQGLWDYLHELYRSWVLNEEVD